MISASKPAIRNPDGLETAQHRTRTNNGIYLFAFRLSNLAQTSIASVFKQSARAESSFRSVDGLAQPNEAVFDVYFTLPDNVPSLRFQTVLQPDRVQLVVATNFDQFTVNTAAIVDDTPTPHKSARGELRRILDAAWWDAYLERVSPVVEQLIVWYYDEVIRLHTELGGDLLHDKSRTALLLVEAFSYVWIDKVRVWFDNAEFDDAYPAVDDEKYMKVRVCQDRLDAFAAKRALYLERCADLAQLELGEYIELN